MGERPYVLLSCGVSLDGCLDDGSPRRLMFSNDADLDRVDDVRAGCDAILVGAGTVRRDDPRLLVRAGHRRAARLARGLAASPLRVTVTGGGDLDPAACFFRPGGDAGRLVYCRTAAAAGARARLGAVATVVDAGDPVDLGGVLADLHARGVRRLMVEGGQRVHSQLLGAGLADELHLVVAPFFVGEPGAPRLVGDGRFPADPAQRARLAEVRPIGDVVLLRYGLSARFTG